MHDDYPDRSDLVTQQYAMTLCDIGVDQVKAGQIQSAIESFDESLRLYPTAEGYTYRGWAYAMEGKLTTAISYCQKAIRLDGQFGNPYNDIGVYLMQLGRLEEAKVWLTKAKAASRYEPRHFPYLNLGHIHTMLGDHNQALIEYVQALEIDPNNKAAKNAIAQMDMDCF